MFNFLKGKKSDLTITLDRANGVYLPGDPVGITVEFTPDKNLKVQGAQVKLSAREEYQYHSVSTSTDSDGNTTEDDTYTWASSEPFADEERFLDATTLTGGTPQHFTFQMRVPTEALPSCMGEIIHLKWQASVNLDRRLATDLCAEAALTVPVLTPGQAAQPGEFGASSEPGEADLTLYLPSRTVVAGQPIKGELRVLPHKNFTSEVRVELVRAEFVPYDQGNSSRKTIVVKLAGSTQFTAEQAQTFPFEITAPSDAAPTCETPNGTITWTINGILNRRLRRDTTVEQSVRMYSARA